MPRPSGRAGGRPSLPAPGSVSAGLQDAALYVSGGTPRLLLGASAEAPRPPSRATGTGLSDSDPSFSVKNMQCLRNTLIAGPRERNVRKELGNGSQQQQELWRAEDGERLWNSRDVGVEGGAGPALLPAAPTPRCGPGRSLII